MHSPLFIQKLFRHKLFLAFIFFLVSSAVTAQPQPYTAANAHSHNDYVQATPFWLAWKAGFGSIEADIFLEGDELLVAHDTAALKKRHALEKLYLQPLDSCIKTNNGYVYPGKRPLILLVDIKTEAVATLNKLVAVLQHYPALIHSPSLLITISGNRPDLLTAGNVDEVLANEDIIEISASDISRLEELVTGISGYTHFKKEGNRIQLFFPIGTARPEEVNRFCFEKGITLNMLSMKKKSLEAKFFELTNN